MRWTSQSPTGTARNLVICYRNAAGIQCMTTYGAYLTYTSSNLMAAFACKGANSRRYFVNIDLWHAPQEKYRSMILR